MNTNTKNKEETPHELRGISIFRNTNTGLSVYNPDPYYKNSYTFTLHQIHDVLINGGGVHGIEDIKKKIDYIQTHTKKEYEYIKLGLPAFTASAEFENRRGKNEPCDYTQIIGFDFDGLTRKQVEEIIKEFKRWGFTLLVFRSPSGNGIKLFVKTDNHVNEHDLVYDCFILYFKEKYKLPVDTQCTDVSRMCYFSYDTEAGYYTDAEIFPTAELIKKYASKVKVSSNSNGNSTQDIINYDTVNTDNIKTIFYDFIKQLQGNGIDWIDDRRNKLMLEICKLKRWGVDFNECLTELLIFINGRYTNEYNASNLPKKLAYNWQRYHNAYEIIKPTKPENSLQINNYLTEQKEFIKNQLLDKGTIFISAPTGSGKTTLIKDLAKELNLKTDILMPTTALVEQQTDIKGITGKKGMNPELLNADVLACCYNSINKIATRNSKLLVIDEAHSLVSDYGFKNKAIQAIQLSLSRYEYVIYLSGSILPLAGYYTENNLLQFDKQNRYKYEYEIITTGEGVTDSEYFINNLTPGKLNVFYQNDKSILDKLYIYFTGKGLKVAYVSKDKKDKEEYAGIVQNSSLEGYDVLLTTCIIQSGVNINKTNREVVITFGNRSNLIDYVQFTARFRKTKPSIKIIHSGRRGALYLTNNDELLNKIELEKKLLEKANTINQTKEYDYKFLDGKIINGYDLVFRNEDGFLTHDCFSLLHNHYLTINRNINSNVRILQHYLSMFNFTQNGNTVDGEHDVTETKALKKISRNYSKEKRQKVEGILDSIFNGSYVFNKATDKVSKDIESKYLFLQDYLHVLPIPERKKLLTSNPTFSLYKSRITYMQAQISIEKGVQVADTILLDYMRLKKLEQVVKIGTVYTSQQLKEIVSKCGYTTTTRSYITKSIGIIFNYEASKNNMHYQVTSKMDMSNYKPTGVSNNMPSLF